MEEIKCPICDHVFQDEDEWEHVTRYGESDPKEAECPGCGTELVIEETVTRIWEVTVKAKSDS